MPVTEEVMKGVVVGSVVGAAIGTVFAGVSAEATADAVAVGVHVVLYHHLAAKSAGSVGNPLNITQKAQSCNTIG